MKGRVLGRVALLASLRARLSLVILLALLPAAFFLLYDVVALRQQVRADAQAELLRLSEVAATGYRQQMDEVRRLMAALTLFAEVRGEDPAACAARLGEMVQFTIEALRGHGQAGRDNPDAEPSGPAMEMF